MSYKSCFSFLLLVFALLCFGARDAYACTCAARPTVLDAYEESDVVVITRVVSVEKAEEAALEGRMSDGENYVDGVKSTIMLVERVFKGNLKTGDEITFGQGGGGDCIWTFSEKFVGEQFLFYLAAPKKNQAHWYGFGCGRSRGLNYATDDLLYLNKLDKVRGRSRISGTIEFEGGDELSVEGRRIRITGAGKTYEVKTDKSGVYELYDLPAGKYLVEPEMPPGWKVDPFYLRYSASFIGDSEEEGAPKKIPVFLEAKKHAALDIHFEINNAVSGKVYDPDGRPMKDVCVALVPAHSKVPDYSLTSDCTEEAGTFEIKEIPAGNYVLVVNQGGKISSSEPFGTFFYPDVSESEKATIVAIGAGQTLEGFDIRVPYMEETVTVEGFLLYLDGRPVEDERIVFKAAKTKATIEGDVNGRTDAKGRFSIKILKGLEGELVGVMFAHLSEFENCSKLKAMIKESPGRTGMVITTDAVKIQAETDLKDVKVRFPFPGCRKAKKQEDMK